MDTTRSGRLLIRSAALAVAATLAGVSLARGGFASTETFLPAIGRIPGQSGAQFYTTIWATNLTSVRQTFTFQFLKVGQANLSPLSFDDALDPGQTKVYENVVETKLGLTDALGAARVLSSGEIFVAERIYNQEPGDDLGNTEGLFFAGVPKSFSISLGQSASIQGIDQGGSDNFRYNFALVETGGGSPTVNVQIFDGSGAMLGQRAFILQPYEQIQPGVGEVVSGIKTINARITATVTGGTGSVLIAGAQVANESQDSSGFEMTFRDSLLGGGGGGSGLTSVTHDASLSGSGTGASPLGIANGQVVRSLNGLHDNLALAAGPNVTITPNGSTLTIASSGGGGGLTLPYSGSTSGGAKAFTVSNGGSETAIEGDGAGGVGVVGKSASRIGVFGSSGSSGYGLALPAGIWGDSGSGVGIAGTSDSQVGIYGHSNGSIGIQGVSATNVGVYGEGDSFGVQGITHGQSGQSGVAGVWGDSLDFTGVYGTSANDVGVRGWSANEDGVMGISYNTGSSWGGYFNSLAVTGTKSFVEPHPTDPTKEIRYVCLEGRESGTYFRGSSKIVNGFAVIAVPKDFRMVSSPNGLTVVTTPQGSLAVLACVRKGLDEIVVQGSADVEFDYVVNGVRKAFSDFQPVSENRDFVPSGPDDKRLTAGLPAESLRRLKATGILNDDGSINLETAHRLGWDQRERWKRAEAVKSH